jgi:hypothetical protein
MKTLSAALITTIVTFGLFFCSAPVVVAGEHGGTGMKEHGGTAAKEHGGAAMSSDASTVLEAAEALADSNPRLASQLKSLAKKL